MTTSWIEKQLISSSFFLFFFLFKILAETSASLAILRHSDQVKDLQPFCYTRLAADHQLSCPQRPLESQGRKCIERHSC